MSGGVTSDDGAREGFLARWSRRKRGVEEEAVAPAPALVPVAPVAPAAEDEPDLSLLPKIEDLTAESDLAPFFAKGVPPALKQAAVSRMWTLDPVIRDFVGPADYAWDFNAPDGVPGFSLALPEEAKSLAKRLLGVDREDEDRAERARAEAPTAAGTTPPAVLPPPVAQIAAPAPPDFVPPTLPPEPPAAGAPEAEAPAAPRRRHGSALPA